MRSTVVSLRLAWFVLASVGLTLAMHSSAHAAPSMKVQCKRAAERAQKFRNEGQLLMAREQLHMCVLPECPSVVRSYCTRWFDEVEADLPTVVIKVRDGVGNDLSDATVAIDGVTVDAWQGGLPIALDPGSHSISCTRPGNPPTQTSVLLGTAEKRRQVTLTLDTAPPDPQHLDPPVAQLPAAEEAPPLAPARPSAAAWVVGGATVLAWGSYAYFGITGKRDLDELKGRCAGNCDPDEVDAAWRKLIIADVSLGVAVLGTGLSTWLFVSSLRKGREQRPGVASIAPNRQGLSMTWSQRF